MSSKSDLIIRGGGSPTLQIKKSSKFRDRYIYYYAFMVPGLLMLLLFRYIPMFGNVIAFKDFTVRRGIFGSEFVGLKWFEQLFSNREFTRVLTNTIYISLLKIFISFPSSIILALMINEVSNLKTKRLIQTTVYLPHFISWAVLGGILFTILSPSVGVLGLFGVDRNPLMNTSTFRIWVIVTDIWKESGWGTVVYLAAMSGISQELYEAARVDGAGRMRRIWHVTLPGIMPTISIMLILRVGSVLFAGFDQMYVLQTPATMEVADVLDTFVYRYGIGQGRFSFGAAAGLFQAVVGLMMVAIANKVSHRMGQDGVW